MNYGKLTAGTTKTAIDTAKPSEKGEIITYLSRMGDVLEQVDKRRKVIVSLLGIHVVGDCNKVDIVLCKEDFRIHTHLQVITAKPGKVFDNDPPDRSGFHVCDHLLERRSFKRGPGIPVIHIKRVVGVAVLTAIPLQHFLLMGNGVAVALVGIIYGQTAVKRCRRIRRDNIPEGKQFIEVRHHHSAPPIRAIL